MDSVIAELENDIAYFKGMNFSHLVEKFERDLKLILELKHTVEQYNNLKENASNE